jgi:hypothetical protein
MKTFSIVLSTALLWSTLLPVEAGGKTPSIKRDASVLDVSAPSSEKKEFYAGHRRISRKKMRLTYRTNIEQVESDPSPEPLQVETIGDAPENSANSQLVVNVKNIAGNFLWTKTLRGAHVLAAYNEGGDNVFVRINGTVSVDDEGGYVGADLFIYDRTGNLLYEKALRDENPMEGKSSNIGPGPIPGTVWTGKRLERFNGVTMLEVKGKFTSVQYDDGWVGLSPVSNENGDFILFDRDGKILFSLPIKIGQRANRVPNGDLVAVDEGIDGGKRIVALYELHAKKPLSRIAVPTEGRWITFKRVGPKLIVAGDMDGSTRKGRRGVAFSSRRVIVYDVSSGAELSDATLPEPGFQISAEEVDG